MKYLRSIEGRTMNRIRNRKFRESWNFKFARGVKRATI
jgi:hypothetical protein